MSSQFRRERVVLDFVWRCKSLRLMPSYARVDGVLVEPLGHLWAAFSPASGETALLNDESAAVLELLESGPSDTEAVASRLAIDCDVGAASLSEVVESTWPRLIEAGLVHRLDAERHRPAVIAVGALASRLLADVDNAEVTQALAGAGLWFNIGAVSMQVRGNAKTLAVPLQTVYGHFPFVTNADWADVHLSIDLAAGLRRWIRPQVLLHADGRVPFDPFPASNALPLFEWGCNWMIGRCCNELLLLHSGALERDGLALLLPATPGSGKSTLTAALSQRGWRLLSDEFGAYDPTADVFRAVLKPIALKNESIAVIRQFAPSATLGPEFPNTRKGTVAHLAAGPDAVARRHETARAGRRGAAQVASGQPDPLGAAERAGPLSSAGFQRLQLQPARRSGFSGRGATGAPVSCLAAHLQRPGRRAGHP
jgi:HprK-related kinase A